MFLPVSFANQRRERGGAGRESEMSGQGEQRVALLQDYSGLSSPCFQQTEAKCKKKKMVLMMMKMKMMAKRLYLEIAKGKGTPAEALNLRKRQSRAVDCSAVRGEPVEQVPERV